MVELQILSQVLQTHDLSIIEDNQLTEEYFPEYQEEYKFITDHYKDYGNVPDKMSFLSQFQEFDLVEVNESESYLVDTIREEHLFSQAVPVVQNVAKLMKTDSNEAVEYLIQAIKELQPNYRIGGTDIIANAMERFEAFMDKREHQENWFFTSGFPELDDIIHGISRTEELFVIVARINQGKSWILEKIVTHIWEIGYNVGYISPEMSEILIGYRFDTLHDNYSNKDLVSGGNLKEEEYKQYVTDIQQKDNLFMVATPLDFKNRITVTKLRQFIKQYKLDALAIDGITYLADERSVKGDTKTTALTNISADLKLLSMELKVPILLVQQLNRTGATDGESDDLPGLDSIKDSDGIAASATIVLALKQCDDNILVMQLKKGRNCALGNKLKYRWNPNIGEFISESEMPISKDRPKPKKKLEKEDMF